MAFGVPPRGYRTGNFDRMTKIIPFPSDNEPRNTHTPKALAKVMEKLRGLNKNDAAGAAEKIFGRANGGKMLQSAVGAFGELGVVLLKAFATPLVYLQTSFDSIIQNAMEALGKIPGADTFAAAYNSERHEDKVPQASCRMRR